MTAIEALDQALEIIADAAHAAARRRWHGGDDQWEIYAKVEELRDSIEAELQTK